MGGYTPLRNRPLYDKGSCVLGCDCICLKVVVLKPPALAISTISIYMFFDVMCSSKEKYLMIGRSVGEKPFTRITGIKITAESR